MKQFLVGRDATSALTYCMPFSDSIKQARLAAGVEASLAVPAGATKALVAASDFIFISPSSITLPTVGAGFGAGVGEQSKGAIDVTDVTNLYCVARQDTDVTIAFFS